MLRSFVVAIILGVLVVCVALVSNERSTTQAAMLPVRELTATPPDEAPSTLGASEEPLEGAQQHPASAVLLEGIILDEDDQPVTAATVVAMTPPRLMKAVARPTGELDPVEQVGGVTQWFGDYASDRFEMEVDDAGRFVLEVAQAGSHFLVASAEGFVVTRVDVSAPAKDLRLVLRAGGQVEGTVVSATGIALPDVNLFLFADGIQTHVAESKSDEQGRFQLHTVLPGRYKLAAVFDTGAPHRVSRVIDVRPSEPTTVTLRMDTGRSVSGTVVDEANRPVAHAEVSARSDPEAHAELYERERGPRVSASSARTDDSGRFTVHHLLPGTCLLSVEKPGYVQREHDGEDSQRTVVAGATDVTLVMRYQGSIRGRLRRSDGSPITRFSINDEPIEHDDGAFRLPLQQPGMTWLTLEAPDLLRTVREVPVEPGQDVDLGDLVLDAGLRIRGRVLDTRTSAPIEGAKVAVRHTQAGSEGIAAPELASAKTDATGAFALAPVEAGSLRLDVSRSGCLPLRSSLRVSEEPLELRLSSGARVTGTVKDREGRPANVVLRVFPLGDHPGHSPTSVQVRDGTFDVAGLEPGEYAFKVLSVHDSLGSVWSERRSGRYVPRRVTLAPEEQRVLQLQEREGRSSLRLRMPRFTGVTPEDVAPHAAVLIPGTVPQVRTYSRFERLMREQGVPGPPKPSSAEVVYDALPAGRYTYVLVGKRPQGGAYLVHTEVLEVPEAQGVTRDLQPVWTPITHIIL
ncbi:carboxypeptidase-like regulatory domain-containing protein [Myxococcus sp. K38C18041901]|uniref:MSCRAMM family protein n=1 Tax=Myxococcus guangdongensis TaxID=2906760 RepID=UPI0020A79954|nr:carboxypeptidase-like regulatory domain-containing protein [Myxococcus guangdongensis]MCP3061111.1 carboxypeptidase-like regulatory domain-containing protein [Myxococcus guangdongensis]